MKFYHLLIVAAISFAPTCVENDANQIKTEGCFVFKKHKGKITRGFLKEDKDIAIDVQQPKFHYYRLDSMGLSVKQETDLIFGSLFSKGILTWYMFVQANSRHKLSEYRNDTVTYDGDHYHSQRFVCVGSFKAIERDSTPVHLRKFAVRVTMKPDDGDGYDVFYLELENKKANKETGLKEFVDNSKLRCLKYFYTEI